MRHTLMEGYSDFMKALLKSCNMSHDLIELPIKISDPNFPTDDWPDFQFFAAPGLIIFIVFYLAVILAGDAFIDESLVSVIH